jgi:hypothetical protein
MKPGWVNLRHYRPDEKKEKDVPVDLDKRFREAAVVLRRRWDRWNEERGLEVDYDTLSEDFPYDEDMPENWAQRKTKFFY